MNEQDSHASPTETVKCNSRGLRGRIAAELGAVDVPFTKETAELVKHHGLYQQQDRDLRKAAKSQAGPGAVAATLFVRTKIPGGRLTAPQFLGPFGFGRRVGQWDVADHFTARPSTAWGEEGGCCCSRAADPCGGVNDVRACGDVTRNVMCCPVPHRQDPVHQQMREMAERLTAQFAPRSRAYSEIWLGGAAANALPASAGGSGVDEPFYGEAYLPRKFKMALGLPGDNCVRHFRPRPGPAGDLRDVQRRRLQSAGGRRTGLDAGQPQHISMLAQPLAFVVPEQVVDAATAVVRVFRDFGNRGDRKRARLKYLLAEWGLGRFRRQVEAYFGLPLAPPRPEKVWRVDHHLGWHDQGDGRWFYGLKVESGRICDRQPVREVGASRNLPHLAAGHSTHAATEPVADGRGRREPRGNRGRVPAARRSAGGNRFSSAAMVDGLCSAAHLPFGAGRERAGAAGRARRARNGTRAVATLRRGVFRADDGLLEQLRPAVVG